MLKNFNRTKLTSFPNVIVNIENKMLILLSTLVFAYSRGIVCSFSFKMNIRGLKNIS